MDYERQTLLSEDELEVALGQVPAWRRDGGLLRRRFEFADFTVAWGFMSSVALIAERLFHHPEWSNVWGTVDIAITNHDAGGLTALDIEFCRRVDNLLSSMPTG